MPKKKHLKCPSCGNDLDKKKEVVDIQGILERKYTCKGCKKKYDRHTIFNSIGLVNYDCLYLNGFAEIWEGG